MTSGWRYSVQIPDFTKEERHGEEIVVVRIRYESDSVTRKSLYVCAVLSSGCPRSGARSNGTCAADNRMAAVLRISTTPYQRRFPFSSYRQFPPTNIVCCQLKGAYPELFKKKEMEPPSKRSLRFVNNNDRLLHERRQQLEVWLWNMLKSNEISHSRFMKAFLQLNLAVRGATTSSAVLLSQSNGREDEVQPDTSSDLSAPSGITNMSQSFNGVHTPGTAKYSVSDRS